MNTQTLQALWGHGLGRFGFVLLSFFLLVALLAPVLAPDAAPHANTMDLEHAASGIATTVHRAGDDGETKSFFYLLGSDRYGRDVLSRLMLGTRISLSVGVVAVVLSLLIGVPIGAAAGFFGGTTDRILSWVIQVFWSIPSFLMVIALSFVLGKGIWQVFVAVGLTMWVEVARLVRGQMISLRSMEFVDAAKVLGFSPWRTIWIHALPPTFSALIVLSASNFASAILLESGLSFLGIGAQPPIPTWGGMIRDHYPYLLTGQPHLVLLPGIALAILVLAFMATGSALRDVLDVRNK